MPLYVTRRRSNDSIGAESCSPDPSAWGILGKTLLPSARISRAPISPPSSPELEKSRAETHRPQSQQVPALGSKALPSLSANAPSSMGNNAAEVEGKNLGHGKTRSHGRNPSHSSHRSHDSGAVPASDYLGHCAKLSNASSTAQTPERKWLGNRMFEVALECFQRGDYHEAARLYTEAANHGSRSALHNLGVMYLHGQGVPQNNQKAREYFTLGALEGVAASMSQLGYMEMYCEDVEPDFQRARLWFVRAIQAGDLGFAAYQLGVLYALGKGVECSYELAAQWLEVSAYNGYLHAQYNLGAMFQQGLGVEKDSKRAASLYHKAARQGHALALNNLAVMYFAGKGVRQDYNKAFRLAQVAAQAQVPEAMFNISDAFLSGRGSKRDPRQALTWLRHASDANFAEAQFVLGCIHLFKPTDGCTAEQIQKNLLRAKELFSSAANAGHQSAAHNLRLLVKLDGQRTQPKNKGQVKQDQAQDGFQTPFSTSPDEQYHTPFSSPEVAEIIPAPAQKIEYVSAEAATQNVI